MLLAMTDRFVQFAKPLVKTVIRFGRRLRAYLTHHMLTLVARSPREIYVTCVRGGGGGAQLHGRYSVAAICSKYNFNFVNTPIQGADFCDGPDWDSNWNALTQFESSNIPDSIAVHRVYCATAWALAVTLLREMLVKSPDRPALIRVQHGHGLTDYIPEILDEFRTEYRQTFRGVLQTHGEEIVVHLRRGSDETASVRFETNEVLISNLKMLRSKYPKKNIRIYTNDAPDLAEGELPQGVVVDDYTRPFAAVSHMAQAQVLLMAKSSLSYVAGLVSSGEVYYPNFWHPPMQDWIGLDELNLRNPDLFQQD